MKKDYLEEAWDDLTFEYDEPYYRSLRRAIWLCLRILEYQLILDSAFVELAHEEFLRLRFRLMEYRYFKQKQENHDRKE